MLAAAWLAIASCVDAWPAATAPEYQVKAVYLFNFGQFVEWPAGAFTTAGAPFVIGILGDDPFGNVIDNVVRGESLAGHPLVVRRFREAEEVRDCNILFIGRSEAPRLERTLRALRGRHILTVTDFDGAESSAAIIVLLTENNRIRMRINVAEARANDLVISSKLLRPAEVIGNEGG
ncbi:MAG TPA: YfiR family protein [Steroidobacteraceae bacterium]